MNNDLISRNALIQHAYSAVVDGVEKDIINLSDVDSAPAVEAFTENDKALAYCEGYVRGSHEAYIRPQGEWKPKTDFDGFTYCVCSNCNWLNCGDELNFCPNCGANMKGGSKWQNG